MINPLVAHTCAHAHQPDFQLPSPNKQKMFDIQRAFNRKSVAYQGKFKQRNLSSVQISTADNHLLDPLFGLAHHSRPPIDAEVVLSIGDKHFLGICLLLPARNPLRVGKAWWKKFTCGSNTSGGSAAGPRRGQHTAPQSNATFGLLESGTVVPKKRSWVSSKLISRQLIFKVDMYLVFTAEFEPSPSHPLPLPSVKATL